ncbi:hypothetical protein COCCADRAFT_84627 [Bipolaris zeicola 26-R-13]|uniref:Uncharacterized protein n=1 Tax=Cochliobolus carbonum (strain 26-R-13) TaxID=930089 RepID=W6YJY6_COCC2|nr:uncharacterized protein COCCADRAFT_84627 [Bipolaris zeicola 26-R-13]EUC37915.1 hypothetical protein COCCADRAFT_84627 [Bipolaris zeicola 26-R-13]
MLGQAECFKFLFEREHGSRPATRKISLPRHLLGRETGRWPLRSTKLAFAYRFQVPCFSYGHGGGLTLPRQQVRGNIMNQTLPGNPVNVA